MKWMQGITFLCLLFASLAKIDGKESSKVPRGHLQEIGLHRDSDGHVDIMNEPYPAEEFWSKYVSKRRPVLLKGAAQNFPAKTLWTDEYLKDVYGKYSVKLEKKKEAQGIPAGDLGLGRDTIKNFLTTYVEENKYVVSQLPKPMYRDILVPPCLSCGIFEDSLVEINYWMSNGGTKSLLHKDAPNILNCVLNGTKNWLLISPKYEHMVPLAREPAMDGGGYSVLKVDKVDLIQFSKFKDCPYWYANVSAGDCLYVPYGTLHHVRSFGDKNMAISYLFSRRTTHTKKFDSKSCENATYKNLTDVEVAWDFDGIGSLTMGLHEPKHYRDSFLHIFKKAKKSILPAKKLLKHVVRDYLGEFEGEKYQKGYKIYKDSLQITDDKETISVDDIKALPMQSWKNMIIFNEMDPANTLQYEYRQFTRSEVSPIFKKAIGKSGIFDGKKFTEAYVGTLGGSERIANEIKQKMDTNGDGIITKEETRNNYKKTMKLFDQDMPPEHVNDYADSYVYRKERPEVPEKDSMDPESDENIRLDDGKGISVENGYHLFEPRGESGNPNDQNDEERNEADGRDDEGNGDEEDEEEEGDDGPGDDERSPEDDDRGPEYDNNMQKGATRDEL